MLLHEVLKTNDNEQVITWVYEQVSFVPTAKLIDGEAYSIVSDYLGTPIRAYDDEGNLVWERELDIYGKVRKETRESTNFVPFRYQGQYYDSEVDLCYNRFRYYLPETGTYISQDPIGLADGMQLYGYVHDTNSWIDPLSLNNVKTEAGRTHVTYQGVKNGLPYTGYASAPSHLGLSPDEIIAYRYNGNFDDFGGVAPKHVYVGEGVKGKQTARGLEQRLY